MSQKSFRLPAWQNRISSANRRCQERCAMFQTDLLKGRTILITGGGTGLGRSMALCFAGLGANLFLIGRREEPLAKTCEEIRAKKARAGYASCDVRDFDAVDSAVAAAEKEFQRVDTLVNN